ncbi:MAG: hypothetical protein Q8P05_04945 [Candidatus Diapherotrites archaeon]|nr:hypothetical protein [Candidatus Diapherotrites archaeon]MDZ4256260.1 hypothetical protein [archaeon]
MHPKPPQRNRKATDDIHSTLTPSETLLERQGQLVADHAIAWAKRVGRHGRPVVHPTYRRAGPPSHASQFFHTGKMG